MRLGRFREWWVGGLVLASGWLGHEGMAQVKPIRVQLTLQPGPQVAVELEFPAAAEGETELALESEWGGITNDGADVSDLSVVAENGEPCTVEKQNATTWKVKHETTGHLTARYRMVPVPDRPKVAGNDYRTRWTENSFQMIGHLGLLMPGHLDPAKSIDWVVTFRDFEKSGWQVVGSLGSGEGPFTLNDKPATLRNCLVLAGKFPVLERVYRNTKIAVAITGNQWQFRPDDLADALQKIVSVEQDFFSDYSDPWYLVTLTPIRLDQPGAYSLGGTALKNCFALYCTPDFTISTEAPDGLRGLTILAHEYFHNWNGIKIPTASENPSTYWFSEGLTTFYARRLLVRAGLMSDPQYVADLNSSLGAYLANPLRLEPNSVVTQSFWTDRNAGQVPYQRGDLLGQYLDEAIRTFSGGARSLDDFMRELLSRPISTKAISTEDLLQRFEGWISPEAMQTLRSVVVEGANVPLPEAITEPRMELKTAQMTQFDPGFDMEFAKQEKTVRGVAPDGNAFRAGLRNGQRLRRASIDQGNSTTPPHAEVVVEVDGQEQTISYEAVGAPRSVPVYRLIDAGTPPGKN